LKHEVELYLNPKRLFYTRCGSFSMKHTNNHQLNPEVVKISPVIEPPVIISNPVVTT
jgi:hypothetical protein